VCLNPKVTIEIVKYLYELQPEAVKLVRGKDERLPLHNACIIRTCPFSVIKFLLSKYPDALLIPWSFTGLPLHCYVGRIASEYSEFGKAKRTIHLDMQAIEFLVESYPEALTNQDNSRRQTPLHLACKRNDVSLSMVQLLIDPEHRVFGMSGSSSRDKPPLELVLACCSAPPPNLAQFLVEHSPAEYLPGAFHEACTNKAVSIELLRMFLDKQPNLVEQPNNSCGNYPLHILCMNGESSLEVVEFVFEAYPLAVRDTNDYGMLPLVYSISRSVEISRFLINKFPDSVEQRDFEGRFPLHCACRNGDLGEFNTF
jgi:ankyrin repeat protein